MHLDFFGLGPHIAALEALLAVAPAAGQPRLLAALAWYLRQRDPLRARALADQARAGLAAVTDAAERKGIEARLLIVSWEGEVLRGEHADAAAIELARSTFESIGDFTGLGDAWMVEATLGRLFDHSEPARARAGARHAYQRCDDPARRLQAELQDLSAAVYGDPAVAHEPSTRQALEAAEALRHPGVDAWIEVFWGLHHSQRSDYAAAIPRWQRAYELSLEVGHVFNAAKSAANLSSAVASLSDYATALEWTERVLQLGRRGGWPLQTGNALFQAGLILESMNRCEAALPMAQEALALLARYPESFDFASACRLSATLALRLDDPDRALALARQCLDVSRRGGLHSTVAAVLTVQAQALSRLGRPAEACEAADEAARLCHDNGYRDIHAHTLAVHAEIARSHRLPTPTGSDAPSAPIHYLKAAEATLKQMDGIADMPPEWLTAMSSDYEAAGDLAQALDCARRAAASVEAQQARKAQDLATAMQVRHETERARAEAAYHQALAEAETRRADAEVQANRAKSAFLANMSHELRSPLNAMLGFTRLLLRDPALDSRREDLSIVMRSGEHLYELINQVLDMSKIEAGHASLVEVELDLHALLHELHGMFALAARAKSLALAVAHDAAVPRHVSADAVKLRQVLINLVGNALKFTHAGQVELMVSAQAHTLGFTVTDTGVGIAAPELAQLGHAFVQARAGQRAAEGTGLGLAISRGFVELMGGELRLSSVPGQGTRAHFAIALQPLEPAAAPAPVAPARRVAGLAAHSRTPRILVVDDRPEGRLLVMRLLGPLGFEVREAADGEQALAVWTAWSPQLVLMDMRMPVMDGREATRRIKATEQGRSTVVIALTASSFEEEREQILAAGCDDFLRKPFQEEALLEMIARHLKLQYVHEDAGAATGVPEPDIERIAQLPEAVRARLRAALERLDVQAVEQAIEAVRGHDAASAAALAALAQRFEYERIRSLIAG